MYEYQKASLSDDDYRKESLANKSNNKSKWLGLNWFNLL